MSLIKTNLASKFCLFHLYENKNDSFIHLCYMHKSAVNSPHILLEEKLRISSILSVHSLFLHVNVNCRLIIHHVLDIKTGN